MRSHVDWEVTPKDYTGPIYALTYSPDGTQLIVAQGNQVVMYSAALGKVIKVCEGHKDIVYCVAYNKGGTNFASGGSGSDRMVIIWDQSGEGLLRYPHNDSIQCLAFNPVTQQLASCTGSDFGLWSSDANEVKKFKATKIICCAWTNDGQYLTLGHFDGTVSIRDQGGREKTKIQRNAPIWCLAWNPSHYERNVLTVGCWDQTISVYHISGQQFAERKIDYDPCAMTYFSNGQYLVVGGSDKKITLWTKEGVKLSSFGTQSNWVWSVAQRPKQNYVTVGTHDGKITTYRLGFSTVHGLHQNQYAYRDAMTNVVIQDLMTNKERRIECKAYVKKIAIYKGTLAIMLPDKVMIYKLNDSHKKKISLRGQIRKKFECNLLVVTSGHIVLCMEKKLQLYSFGGDKEREWNLESLIRYIKVIGGPPLKEALLVGLRNGTVLKIFIDNSLEITLLKHSKCITCLDLSLNRDKLALIDVNSNVIIYDLVQKKFTFKDTKAHAVAWNSSYNDMLCYTGFNTLHIKTGDYPSYKQKFNGFVVGFKESKVFGLHGGVMNTTDIPQSYSLYCYLRDKQIRPAYKIACLGVSDSDWRLLAFQALLNLDFEIARKAFTRSRDMKYLSLLNMFEQKIAQKEYNENAFLGEIYAYLGRFSESAAKFVDAGESKKAIDMLCDLRQWEQAKNLATSLKNVNVKELIQRQAVLAEEDGDMLAAATLYVACEEYHRAINILGENKWYDNMAEILESLDEEKDKQAIQVCAKYFAKADKFEYARRAYQKVQNFEALIKLSVKMKDWNHAFSLLETHPQYKKEVYVPYAHYLAENDRFDDSMAAFIEADEPEEAIKMIEVLAHNSVVERRYNDSSYYFFLLSIKSLELLEKEKDEANDDQNKADKAVKRRLNQFVKFRKLASIYYAYHSIHQYSELPFNSLPPQYLFNMARFILMNTSKSTPYGINKANLLLALGRLGTSLENYSLAREAYQHLNMMRLPQDLRSEVDLNTLLISSKPMTNKDDSKTVCFRCSTTNPLLQKVDRCLHCLHPFVRSFSSYVHLPLVEFALPTNLDHETAMKLVSQEPTVQRSYQSKGDGWQEEYHEDAETLRFDAPEPSSQDDGDNIDPFSKLLMASDHKQQKYAPLSVSEDLLKSFEPSSVFVVEWPTTSLPKRYFKSVFQDAVIVQCKNCNSFFHGDEFEFALFKTKNCCPLCRAKQRKRKVLL